jgi:hypothetical protein
MTVNDIINYDLINIVLTLILIHQTFIYFKPKKDDNMVSYKKMDPLENIENSLSVPKVPDVKGVPSFEACKYWYLKGKDYNAVYDPLSPPEKRIESRQYPYPNTQFGERTRGEADDYQLVGLLYNTTANKNYQLFGRRTYPGSYEWEYYIRGKDAGGLDFKFPLKANNKKEIMDGEKLTIPIDSNEYTVTIYDYDQYRYNPYVL